MSSNDTDDITKNIEPAIQVCNLTKYYQIYDQPVDRLKQMIWRKKSFYRNFTALRNINLTIPKGETVGIIGRNGSGKSTLLQIICQTLQASKGEVKIEGRVAALLELGAGFNPEFTGRENVYLHGTIHGFTRKQMDEQYPAIADFADIGEFIDQPVKTYSSGMYVRLAFAAAIHADPEILVIDEALSVGDEAFRRKCFARIDEIQKRGSTILFVSHSAQSIVQLCSHAILLDAGEVILEGEPKRVINQYQKLMNLSGKEAATVRAKLIGDEKSLKNNQLHDYDAQKNLGKLSDNLEGFDPALTSASCVEYDQNGAMISDIKILSNGGELVNILQRGRTYHYQYKVTFTRPVKNIGLGVLVKTTTGVELGGANTQFDKTMCLPSAEAGQTILVKYTFVCSLVQGMFFLNAGVGSLSDGEFSYLHRIVDAYAFRIAPEPPGLLHGNIDFGFDIKITKL